MGELEEDRILYRQVKSLKASQLQRFKINYFPPATNQEEAILNPPKNLWVKIKNKELIALRAAYIAGPYVLYVDCKPEDYDSNKKCFITADQPVFEPQLLPGQSFYAELSCHTFKEKYCWVVDIVSQIIFNNTIDIDFEITVGTSKKILHEAGMSENKVINSDRIGLFENPSTLIVSDQDTMDLWNLPVPDTTKPIHLVILTHGLHSNVSADMLYLKEEIDKVGYKDNIVVKGFFGNICKTERGIKYLGSRVAEYIVELVTKNEQFNNGKVKKISFIAHSLGGLVQTFAIAYLKNNFPWFFDSIIPVNFITLASPLLGVVNDNPVYIKLALLAGIVGMTGQDLGLKFVENDDKPLLLLLPTGPTHQVLKKFVRRTVYSNVINDGIVPLRTSALLFLDYKGLSQIMSSNQLKEGSANKIPPNKNLEIKDQDRNKNEDSIISLPMQAMLSYFMPQKQQKQSNGELHRYQTMTDLESSSSIDHVYKSLPKASVLETATSLILPPLPSLKYITNPDARENVIIHDQLYKEEDLPPKDTKPGFTRSGSHGAEGSTENGGLRLRQRILNTLDYSNVDTDALEEDIAREYHKNMTWRKVLVKLKPDAHNNIIVRRRFSNAYGWPVIEHLVKNHFDISSGDEISNSESSKIQSVDSLDNQIDLSSILSRDLISRQNEIIDQQKEKEKEKQIGLQAPEESEHTWINSKDNSDSIFAVGPTGLLSDVSEIVGNLRDQWYNGYSNATVNNETLRATHSTEDSPPIETTGVKFQKKDDSESKDDDEFDLGDKTLMGNFI